MTDETKILLQDFNRRLNLDPDPRELDDTPDGKARTLPISFVEMTLDELYLGQWETTEPTYQQIFNEVVGAVTLTVWHPITQRAIKRVGFASVVITQDKDATIADFNMTKKKNALDLTFPKLKAECVKNAAQSLGKIFGRDVNRKKKDSFRPTIQRLNDEGFNALIKRLDAGEFTALPLAREMFLLDDTQKSILEGYESKAKQLTNG